jgi:2-oxoglutarate ferredoxin oxidoreductase subunit beta
VPLRREITADSDAGRADAVSVTMHDGSVVRFRRVAEDYDPTDREGAYAHVRALQQKGEVATGLLYIDGTDRDMHVVNRTVARPLVDVPFDELCPGSAALDQLMEEFR